MAQRTLGVIMNGVSGRMGVNQHLIRSVLAIRAQGGVLMSDGSRVTLDPVLVGRTPEKVKALAERHGGLRWTTDLDAEIANPANHIYCEKPIATNLAEALKICRLAKEKGLKNGTVQDKLFLPGLQKIRLLRDSGFFGRIFAVRGEFGYWVFEGDWQAAQRPSWNYRDEDGGGIVLDMVCHWRYVLDNLFGTVQSVSCIAATHIPERVDEDGKRYKATADDAAYASFQLEGGIIAHINMSWAVRVYRDDLVTFQVDGTLGSAVAGLTDCMIQPRAATPRPVWNPDEKQTIDFYQSWQKMPDNVVYENGFKAEWEMFIRHVVEDAPFNHTLVEGAKGVQLVECALQSWKERRWVDVPPLKV